MSSLRFLERQTSSQASSLDFTDVFTADFDIYKLTFDFGVGVGSDNINLRFISHSGNVLTNANYDTGHIDVNAYTTNSDVNQNAKTSATNIALSHTSSNSSGGAVVYIFNPFNPNVYTFMLSESSNWFNSSQRNRKNLCVFQEKVRCTGFKLIGSSGNAFNNFDATIYGIRGS